MHEYVHELSHGLDTIQHLSSIFRYFSGIKLSTAQTLLRQQIESACFAYCSYSVRLSTPLSRELSEAGHP